MTILQTDRLILQKLTLSDAGFILRLVNEPAWLRFIGDRGVRTLEDARQYILNGPMKSYEQFGFGLYRVAMKESEISLGMCGLIKREALEDVDIGFAFLPEFWGQGYAYEVASAVLALGKNTFGLKRIAAITDPDNSSSIKLIEKLGFCFQKMVRLSADDIEVKLYARDL